MSQNKDDKFYSDWMLREGTFPPSANARMHPAVKAAIDEAYAKQQYTKSQQINTNQPQQPQQKQTLISSINSDIRQPQPQQIQENNYAPQEPVIQTQYRDYPQKGTVVLLFDNQEIEWKKDGDRVLMSPIQLVHASDYENEEELREHIMQYNDHVKSYTGSGSYIIYVGKKINVVQKIDFEI